MDISNGGEIFDQVFRIYLRDQERAGEYFVAGGMYASLAMHLLKVVLAFRYSSEDEHGKQKENDHNETSDDMDDDHMPEPDHEGALDFAISSLPFYLSNADYNPKLVELFCSILYQETKEKLLDLYEEIDQLCEAIDLYLEKEPLTPNEAQLNESQAVAECFRADKRRRESNDDLEVTGASALSLTSKRTKVMDLDVLSPTEVLGPDPASEEPMGL
ncbi:hypothetical protein GALMADRAFT_243807 [Galerina marginata CBS 339.88]|uniref:Uncharacterized protein n=1 Tax=Galerina marginata (strain CBS 339.88) TaxID=685588 RepID=A0A067TF02_GALM3|nr:hypothetical protein GALMADRAFT_243807 [Galerina marginata CBS 339.88]